MRVAYWFRSLKKSSPSAKITHVSKKCIDTAREPACNLRITIWAFYRWVTNITNHLCNKFAEWFVEGVRILSLLGHFTRILMNFAQFFREISNELFMKLVWTLQKPASIDLMESLIGFSTAAFKWFYLVTWRKKRLPMHFSMTVCTRASMFARLFHFHLATAHTAAPDRYISPYSLHFHSDDDDDYPGLFHYLFDNPLRVCVCACMNDMRCVHILTGGFVCIWSKVVEAWFNLSH